MSSAAWKNLERQVAKELGGTRISRGDDFSRKDVDVVVPDFELLKVDAKYRKRAWNHHAYLDEIQTKYCRAGSEDMPILVTKNHKQRGANLTMRLDHFGLLLDAMRELRAENERLKSQKGR